ncbi:hypothetical protein GIB67_015175 [Kingdonia uniflora]|uniref:BED-type domain-containing protein n=1 Tax=Kingdonia uniflora TaxID=39325 RepID=A0A7J7LJE6_9MAGN|nr:hypothetical protein GIB67_015175 [Kingdonia uniflora]
MNLSSAMNSSSTLASVIGTSSANEDINFQEVQDWLEMEKQKKKEDELESLEVASNKKRKTTSEVWNHFTKVQGLIPPKAKCNYCSVLLNCDSIKHGTSSLSSHM